MDPKEAAKAKAAESRQVRWGALFACLRWSLAGMPRLGRPVSLLLRPSPHLQAAKAAKMAKEASGMRKLSAFFKPKSK